MSIDILQQREFNFLYRFESNVATIWEIKPWNDKLKTEYSPIFSCFWPENSPSKPRLAVVNSERQIQVMNGFNVLNETDAVDSRVKAICFSHCGNKVAYGLESGRVYEYEIKTRQYQNLMDVQSPVIYLEYFEGNDLELASFHGPLVASGQNGKIMVNCRGRSACLISPSAISKVSIRPIVQCFYISEITALLTVFDNRIIKAWYLNNGEMEVLKPEKISLDAFIVTTSALKNDVLAVGMSDGMFEVYRLVIEPNKLKLVNFGGNVLSASIRSCSFNYDSKLLALGCNDGNIVIYNTQINRTHATLNLHKTAVRHLVFSPSSESILVSIGEQIAWWSVNRIPENLINRRSYRKYRRDGAINNLSTQLATINLQSWSEKVGTPNKPHLLRTFKLQGSCADCVVASPNFNSFVSIDDSGKLYIIELLE